MVSLALYGIGSLRGAMRRGVSDRLSTRVQWRSGNSSANSRPCAPLLNVRPARMNERYTTAGDIGRNATGFGPPGQRPDPTVVLPRALLPPTRGAIRIPSIGPFPRRPMVPPSLKRRRAAVAPGPASRCLDLRSCLRRSLVIRGIVSLPPTSRGLLYPSMAGAIKRGASSQLASSLACMNSCYRSEVPLPRRAMRVPLSLATHCRSKNCTTCDRPSRLAHLRT